MQAKVELSFEEISRRLKSLALPEIDRVIGIASGGTMPAALVAHQLSRPFSLMQINYRDEVNQPRHERPKLLGDVPAFAAKQRILLVDDVSVSGATLEVAKATLSDHEVITLVLKGKADLVAFPEISACVKWPWKVDSRQ